MKNLIENGAYLVDVRTPEEFAAGHVNASVNIPLDQIVDHIDELKSKSHVIVFCKSGMRSEMAKSILNQAGMDNVTNGGPWGDVKMLID
ncbi:MAG: rhodanese-like domain-containing protein [Bacteroidetes bacterium]|nr:rhodanese-like domain-containing protein [Bacteroidota bacterium]